MTSPIDLRERFGGKYRITWDEAREGRDESPWLMQIPCAGRGVTVYPHGGSTLAVEVNNRRGVSARLAELGLTQHQDGDREKTFLLDVADFDRVAAVVRPRRRRHLSERVRDAFAAGREAGLAALRAGNLPAPERQEGGQAGVAG
jgi:hypothetical protein